MSHQICFLKRGRLLVLESMLQLQSCPGGGATLPQLFPLGVARTLAGCVSEKEIYKSFCRLENVVKVLVPRV